MRPETFQVEATYLPGALGAYMWHEFDRVRTANDMQALRQAGFECLRVHLAWDAFMPTHRQVSRPRLRDLEALLNAAADASLRIVPVLFAQSFGDVVMLPRYAVERNAPRRGVRVVSDGSVEMGGPRDLYADPLMLEAGTVWLDALLDGFANHPVIAAWDLGHDPATTVRPRRSAEMARWAAEMAGRVRARQDECRLTLGAGDVLSARGVRVGPLAALVDRLDIAVMPQRLRFGRGWPDVEDVAFLVHLTQALAGDADVGVQICAASGALEHARGAGVSARDPGIAPPPQARTFGSAVAALTDSGAVAAGVWPSHLLRGRAAAAPPCDRWPSLAHAGVVGEFGALTDWGTQWSAIATTQTTIAARAPWPPVLDVEEYYGNLPDATRDLFSEWRGGRSGHPAIVD